MAGKRCDLLDIVDEMSEEEKNIFYNESTNKYYKYLEKSESFKRIIDKVEKDEEILEDEWIFLLKKLFTITCKAMSENEELTFWDKLPYVFAKAGMRLSEEDSDAYNESYKMVQYIDSIKQADEIIMDLFHGLEVVSNTRRVEDLNILLKQHREAYRFREYKDRFYDSYSSNDRSDITPEERVSINSFNRFYEKEKSLVKTY